MISYYITNCHWTNIAGNDEKGYMWGERVNCTWHAWCSFFFKSKTMWDQSGKVYKHTVTAHSFIQSFIQCDIPEGMGLEKDSPCSAVESNELPCAHTGFGHGIKMWRYHFSVCIFYLHINFSTILTAIEVNGGLF